MALNVLNSHQVTFLKVIPSRKLIAINLHFNGWAEIYFGGILCFGVLVAYLFVSNKIKNLSKDYNNQPKLKFRIWPY